MNKKATDITKHIPFYVAQNLGAVGMETNSTILNGPFSVTL